MEQGANAELAERRAAAEQSLGAKAQELEGLKQELEAVKRQLAAVPPSSGGCRPFVTIAQQSIL